MEWKLRWQRIKEANFKPPYSYFLPSFTLFYLLLSSIINKFHIVLPTYFKSNLWIAIPILILNILVGVFFAATINLLIFRYKEQKTLRKEAGLAPVGLFVGILGGLCPGCFAGLFPSIFALFGVTITLTQLPLFGAEFLLGAMIIMGIGIYILANPQISCKT